MTSAAIAVVEAAYSFAEDESTWLARLCDAAGPLLDRGLGVLGYFFDMRRHTSEWLDAPVRSSADRAIGEAVVAVHKQRPAAERVRPYLARDVAITASQIYARGARSSRAADEGQRAALSLGFSDLLRVKAHANDRVGCVIAAPLPRFASVHARDARRFAVLSAHVAAALRLRLALPPVVAILDENGRAVHSTVSRTALDGLRDAARAVDRARRAGCDSDEALSLWSRVLSGDHSIIDRFDTDGRRFFVVRRNPAAARDPRGLTQKEREVAAGLSRGEANKAIAFDLGLAEGTAASHAASIREKLGTRSRAALAHALACPSRARTSKLTIDRDALVVLSAPMPKHGASSLTAAERDVATRAVDGASNAEIANARGCSTSTVVNQLLSIYRKLGIHSRAQLAAHTGG